MRKDAREMDQLIEDIRAAVSGELRVEKKEPLFQSGESPYLDQLLELLPGTVTGFEHGASDARFLSQYGMRGIVWGADGEMSQHTSEEHLVIDSVHTLFRHLDTFLRKVYKAARQKTIGSFGYHNGESG